eukprot:scaffold65647_cov58-Cyclotella_meneghiniana.AAC.3
MNEEEDHESLPHEAIATRESCHESARRSQEGPTPGNVNQPDYNNRRLTLTNSSGRKRQAATSPSTLRRNSYAVNLADTFEYAYVPSNHVAPPPFQPQNDVSQSTEYAAVYFVPSLPNTNPTVPQPSRQVVVNPYKKAPQQKRQSNPIISRQTVQNQQQVPALPNVNQTVPPQQFAANQPQRNSYLSSQQQAQLYAFQQQYHAYPPMIPPNMQRQPVMSNMGMMSNNNMTVQAQQQHIITNMMHNRHQQNSADTHPRKQK